MGELMYIINLDQMEYINPISKMRELELNPQSFHLLLAMLQSKWNYDRIVIGSYRVLEQFSTEKKQFKDVTEKAKAIMEEW